jgi:methyl-accepting chemotaxis protein
MLTSSADRFAEANAARAALADELEHAVLRVSEQVATAATEMGASANGLADFARAAVTEAERGLETVTSLRTAAGQILSAVDLINQVAKQTRLLALNATIEAARAGEAGKGFAVVANEVKELAKETAKATEDISQKIEAIQGDTRGAVEAIEEISSIIGQINDIQSSIASAVEEQTATTNEIARNVSEAARGSGEIAENITGVATAAQGTAKGAEETQRAAGELAQMATELQALVDRFRV